MTFASNTTNAFFLLAVLAVILPVQTYAFGAGDIPDFAYLNDKAFRHGDIENILETLVKSTGGAGAAFGSGGLLGIASAVIKQAVGGSKFTKNDIKKVYFGNWLRDYSQAMDIAGLTKLSADTLVLIVSILGFMTFGYSTEEFAVTADRLGVYLPVEHIDNPKGYAEKEGDARNFHPKLRPPVQRQELEIDERTGMKKYIASENQGWDTSTSFIRRTFRACIEAGRRAQGREGAELWEAYRLLGTGLHTMEDLLAHSNWCEIALRKLGYREVFCHVGDRVTVNTPNGPAPPLVTGTFGGADFLHSLLGEAGDKLSQASVTDLSQKMDNAGNKNPDIGVLKSILSKIGGGGEDKLNKGEEIGKQSQGYHFNPDNVAPPEVQKRLLDILQWHDDVMRNVSKKIEMVPGLQNLMEEFSNALNEYIYTLLAPYVGPLMTQATSVLDEGSKAVINNEDQYEVFDNPNAHDPSHSLLSKDHFGLILNEPAGKIAQIVVEHTVNLIVPAWSDNSNPDDVINRILEAFHHPYYATGRSEIQRKMFDEMQKWIGGQGQEAQQIIQCLTKQSVRDHKNKRQGLDDVVEPGYHGCGGGPVKRPAQTQGVTAGYGVSKPSQGYGGRTDNTGYGASQQTSSNVSSQGGYGQGRNPRDDNTAGYTGYGSQKRDDNSGYGGQRRDDNAGYGSQKNDNQVYGTSGYGGQRTDNTGYGTARTDNLGYGGQRTDNTGFGAGRTDNPGYGGQRNDNSGYGGQRQDNMGYGGKRRDDSSVPTPSYGNQRQADAPSYKPAYSQSVNPSYGAQTSSQATYGGGDCGRDSGDSYGGRKDRDDDDDNRRKVGYGGGNYGGKIDDDDGIRKTQFGGGQYGGRGRDGHDDDDKKQRYGGEGYGRKNDDDDDDKRRNKYGGSQTSYGGYGRKNDGDDDDDDKKRNKYGGGGQSSHGMYGGRNDDDDNDDRKKKHGGGGYGRTKDDDSDDDKRKKQSGYGQVYGGASHSGYNPSYGGQNETFGAERLNIRGGKKDDSDDDDEKRRRKHGGERRY